jgi:hypothetical protein
MRTKHVLPALIALAVPVLAAGCGGSDTTSSAGQTVKLDKVAPARTTTRTTSSQTDTTQTATTGSSSSSGNGTGGSSYGGSNGTGGGSSGGGSGSGSTGGSYAPTPSVSSSAGRHALQRSPDCQNTPPPPPGYHGPVQC